MYITRVMLCLPLMLILDETTSSIDTRTEMHIQEADVILVMDNGNTVEQGNHRSLLEKGGFYARLFNSKYLSGQGLAVGCFSRPLFLLFL